MTPEEKLLRAILVEKASDVRDTSLRLPPGPMARSWKCACSTATAWTRTSARCRSSGRGRTSARDRDDELAILERNIYARLKTMVLGKTAVKAERHQGGLDD